MSPLLSALFFFFSLIVSSFSYNRQAAEQELRFLTENAHTYLTELLIWVAVVSVLVFAMILCICDIAIRMLFNICRTPPQKVVDVENRATTISTTAASGEEYAVPHEFIVMGRRSILI